MTVQARTVTREELGWIDELVVKIGHVSGEGITPKLRHYLLSEVGSEVRARGLWAPHLPRDMGGGGFSSTSLAEIFERLGREEHASIAFGCWPPDSVNGLLLAHAGSPEQRQRWLMPLVEGSRTSAFAMTEPASGSDPTQMESRAAATSDGWKLSGTKWWVTNGSRADFFLAMFVTDPEAPPHERASIFVLPADTSGVEVVRDIPHLGSPVTGVEPVDVHSEIRFRDVHVGPDALLGSRGAGFRLAQVRLGAARIQHCMRWIGLAEKALELMSKRATQRYAHGSRLIEKSTIQRYIAHAATHIHLSRLLVQDAARSIDAYGAEDSRHLIAMAKVFVARALCDIVDNAIQVHGALGVSDDLPLQRMYRYARLTRIFDGPDEVHEMTIAKLTATRLSKRDERMPVAGGEERADP